MGSRVRSVVRWTVRVVATLVVLLVLVVVAIAIVLRTRAGAEWLRGQLVTVLDKEFVGGAHVGRVDAGVFGDVVIHDLVIDGADGQPAISARVVRVKLALLPLLVHRVHVESIDADDVELDDRRAADGEPRLAGLTKPATEPLSWRIALDDISIHRARVAFTLGAVDAHVDDCELWGRIDVVPNRRIAIAATARGRWRERAAPIAVAGSMELDGERLVVPSVSAAVGSVGVVALAIEVPRGAALAAKGHVGASAPAAELLRLFDARVPADVAVAIAAVPAGDGTALALDGRFGAAPVHGFVVADARARRVRGAIVGDAIAIAAARLGGVAAIDVELAPAGVPPHGRAAIAGWVERAGLPRTGAIIAADSAGERATVAIAAANVRGVATAHVDARRRADRSLHVGRATVRAVVTDPFDALHGRLAADLVVVGEVSPHASVAIAGRIDGEQLVASGVEIRALHARVDAAGAPARPHGTARIELAGIARPNLALERIVIDVADRSEGRLGVSLRTAPDAARTRAELDAVVASGSRITIDLERHFVRVGGGAPWTGRGGRIAIDRERVSIRGFRSTSRDGHLAIDATYARAGRIAGDLAARISAKLSVGTVVAAYQGTDVPRYQGTKVPRYQGTKVPRYQGTLEATVDLSRKRGAWTGRFAAAADRVGRAEAKHHLDGTLEIVASARKIHATVAAKLLAAGVHAGGVDVALELDMPVEPTRLASWRALRRDAIHRAELKLEHLAIATVGEALGTTATIDGALDGSFAVTPTDASGSLHARGLAFVPRSDVGVIDAELRVVSPERTRVDVAVDGKLARAGSFHAQAELAPPDRLLDVAAWRQLGGAALRDAAARVSGLEITPALAERLGLPDDVQGRADATLSIDASAPAARLSIDVKRLRGGALVEPIAARIDVQTDATDTTLQLDIRTRGAKLVDARLALDITLVRALRDRRAVRTAPLRGTIELPLTPLPMLAAMAGNYRATAGTIVGTIAVGGTLARPTATANVVARDVAVAPETTRVAPAIDRAEIVALWDGRGGHASLIARARDGGTLRAELRGSLASARDADATLVAHRFDLAPLAAFAPGVAGGTAGTLDADVRIHGLDPRTLAATGQATISDARIPIAPQIGTLLHGRATIAVRERVATIKLGGALGSGKLSLDATAPLPGATTSGRAHLVVEGVQLIGATEPIISARIDSDVVHDGTGWHANVRVAHGEVHMPKTNGEQLRPIGPPRDVLYGDPARVHAQLARTQVTAEHRAAGPAALVANIDLGGTDVVADEFRGVVGGKLAVSVGPGGTTAVGTIAVRHGDVTLFDRRYTVDRAELTYDGTLDPIVAVRLTYDFPDASFVVEVHDRLSKPRLVLSSVPGNHGQEELLGWLLGGQPGGDPRNAPSASERVTSAAGSLIAVQLGGYIKRALPFDIDVLRYEAATSTSSAAITVGRWITHSLFTAYRQRPSARPDENTGEAELEYWIRTRLVLQGTVGDRGYDAVDLLWRRRW